MNFPISGCVQLVGQMGWGNGIWKYSHSILREKGNYIPRVGQSHFLAICVCVQMFSKEIHHTGSLALGL